MFMCEMIPVITFFVKFSTFSEIFNLQLIPNPQFPAHRNSVLLAERKFFFAQKVDPKKGETETAHLCQSVQLTGEQLCRAGFF